MTDHEAELLAATYAERTAELLYALRHDHAQAVTDLAQAKAERDRYRKALEPDDA